MKRIAVIVCLLLTHGVATRHAQDFRSVVEVDVTTSSGSRGVMVRPPGSGPFPAILHLHGAGETAAGEIEVLRIFAKAGYVAMDVDYRGSGPNRIDISDIYKSIDYLNESRFVRSGAIALNGFSLGGRMSLRVAASRKVVAVSAIAARTTGGSTPTVLQEVGKLTCPILLQHGTDDSVVPYEDAVLLDKSLKSLGRDVTLLSYPGSGHNNLPWGKVYGEVLSFFRTHLRG